MLEPSYKANWGRLRSDSKDLGAIERSRGQLDILDRIFEIEKEIKEALENWHESATLGETYG